LLLVPLGLFLSMSLQAEGQEDKVQGVLKRVCDEVKAARQDCGSKPLSSYGEDYVRVKEDGSVHAYVYVKAVTETVLQKLRDLGCAIEIVSEKQKIAQCWVPLDKLGDVAALPETTRLRAPDYCVTLTGSVTTEGDAILRADSVRALGYTGAGVKVGIISDGVDSLAFAVASGDLPANVEVIPGFAGNGDEGTAMLEIVHDLAPGASLAFASGFPTALDTENAINALRAAGCDVICDDIGIFTSPYFEDGPVAQTAQAAVDNGVFYCAAAGNHSRKHYEADFSDLGQRTEAGQTFNNVHDFGGGDYLVDLTLISGYRVDIEFQWSNRFGAATDDYDMRLSDGTNILATSAKLFGNNDPIERLRYTPSSNGTGYILINRSSGGAARLEFFILDPFNLITPFEHVVGVGSIVGHQSAPGVFAVGAIAANDPGYDNVESFSSQGPCLIYYPTLVNRNKPEACGIDRVSVTGVGFVTPFPGTSAAAPHIAGVAALLLQARPGTTPAVLRNALQAGAADIEAPGYDFVAGSGRIDAYGALGNLVPRPQSVTVNPGSVLGGGTSVCTVTLEYAVLQGTVTVTLQSNSSVVTVPANVTISAPNRTANFLAQTQAVAFPTTVTISATSGGATASGDVAVVIQGGTASGGGGGGGCFLATAAYGTELHPAIDILSNFRDSRLLPARMGQDFTRTYYGNSPPMARLLERSKLLRCAARRCIAPLARCVGPVPDSSSAAK
jgi:subtilisin family serine protease